MSEKINISSPQVNIISTTNDIKANSNTFIHLSSNDSIKLETNLQDKQSKTWIASPIIQLGVETKTSQYEPIVKGDELEKELEEIYKLLLDIVSFPGAQISPIGPTTPAPPLINMVKGKLESFEKKNKKWKSTISKTA